MKIDINQEDREKIFLESVVFNFTQESNCVDQTQDDIESLSIRCESSLGITRDNEAFFILKTDQWAINDPNEIHQLISKVQQSISVFLEK